MTDIIYLDNNATTQVAPEVVEAMMPYLSEFYGNPSSMHHFGAEAGRGLSAAREQVASFLGARAASEIICWPWASSQTRRRGAVPPALRKVEASVWMRRKSVAGAGAS